MDLVFICISVKFSNVEHFLNVPVGHLCIFFGEMSIWLFCPLFGWVLFFNIELCELSINFGYWWLTSHIICKFFHSVGGFFSWLLYFAVQMLFPSGPICVFFLLFLLPSEKDPKNVATPYVIGCSTVCLFAFFSVMVSDLTFRTLIHFEFIVVYDVRKYSNLIFSL